jgi:hypothetical protein
MEIEKMIATVQVYIHWTKGVNVDIRPDLPRELPLLIIAYDVAHKWVQNNIKSSNIVI